MYEGLRVAAFPALSSGGRGLKLDDLRRSNRSISSRSTTRPQL